MPVPTPTTAEYQTLHHKAIVIDRSDRGRMWFAGQKAGEVLTGLVTNDVLALTPGQGQYAAVLTSKGKIVSDVRIFADEGSYLVDAPPRARDAWSATVRKFVNPRLARYMDQSDTLRVIGVFGATARHVVAEMTGVNATSAGVLPLYSHVRSDVGGVSVTVARVPDLGLEGFDLFVPADAYESLWQRAVDAGALAATSDVTEIARVEAGRPEFGVDMDDTTLAQEANLEELGAISYTKGCYVGQEVVARVHFRGHVNRHLRGVRATNGDPPPAGARLVDSTDGAKELGDVRSGVGSPRCGGIALAMVRREVPAGTTVLATWDGGERHVDVVPLPFVA